MMCCFYFSIQMTSNRTKSSSSSENGMPGSPISTVAFLPHKSEKDKRGSRNEHRLVKIVLAAVPILLLLALVIVLVILLTRGKSDDPKKNGLSGCRFSDEAKRVGLDSFLNELLQKYHKLMPEKLGSKPGVTPDEVRKHYRPYDPHPSAIKNFTDEVRRLHDRLEEIIGKSDGPRMKLRENKAMYVAQHLLQHSFDWGPYERNYYVGDWMFEPNLYCWQPICYVLSNLEGVILYFKPNDLKGLEQIEQLFKKHNETISRYIENLKLGVATGMVRSVESCKAGIHATKKNYYEIAIHNETGEAFALFWYVLGEKAAIDFAFDLNSYARTRRSLIRSLTCGSTHSLARYLARSERKKESWEMQDRLLD